LALVSQPLEKAKPQNRSLVVHLEKAKPQNRSLVVHLEKAKHKGVSFLVADPAKINKIFKLY